MTSKTKHENILSYAGRNNVVPPPIFHMVPLAITGYYVAEEFDPFITSSLAPSTIMVLSANYPAKSFSLDIVSSDAKKNF